MKVSKQKKEKKETSKIAKTISATNGVVKYGGVWTSPEIVGTKVKEFDDMKWSASQMMNTVYSQIVYYRDVIKTMGKRELFQKTCLWSPMAMVTVYGMLFHCV